MQVTCLQYLNAVSACRSLWEKSAKKDGNTLTVEWYRQGQIKARAIFNYGNHSLHRYELFA